MTRKFEMIEESKSLDENITLHRIVAVRDFGNVKAGTVGGFIQSPENLSHSGLCWIAGDACVLGFARVSGNALVKGRAVVRRYACVHGNAVIQDDAILKDSVHVFDDAIVGSKSYLAGGAAASGNARVFCEPLKGEARHPNIRDYGTVTENAQLLERAVVRDKGVLRGNAILRGHARIVNSAVVSGDTVLGGCVRIMDEAMVFGQARLGGQTTVNGRSVVYGRCKIGGRSIIACNARVAGSEELINFRISGDQCYGIGLTGGKRT